MSKKSDDKFVNELFRTHKQMMFKIAMGILHNSANAEDVVQDAFLWMFNNLEKISRIPCYERGFYFANIIEHASLNLIKRQKHHPLEDIDKHENIASDYSVEEQADDNIMINEIEQALQDLSDRDFGLMYLYIFKDMKYKDIAQAMNIPEKNIHAYIERARKRLIKILKERGVSDDI